MEGQVIEKISIKSTFALLINITFDFSSFPSPKVVLSPVGKHDVRKFLLQGNRDLYKRYNYYATEKVVQKIYALDKEGKDVSQFVTVSDLAGVTSKQLACLPCIQVLSEMTKDVLENYPNILYQTIIINGKNGSRKFGIAFLFTNIFLQHQDLLEIF